MLLKDNNVYNHHHHHHIHYYHNHHDNVSSVTDDHHHHYTITYQHFYNFYRYAEHLGFIYEIKKYEKDPNPLKNFPPWISRTATHVDNNFIINANLSPGYNILSKDGKSCLFYY